MTPEGETGYIVLSAQTQVMLDEMVSQAEAKGWMTMPGAYNSEGLYYQPMKRKSQEPMPKKHGLAKGIAQHDGVIRAAS